MSDGSLDLACVLAERMAAQAIWWRDACTFVTALESESSAVRYGTCDGSLYSGTAGIARTIGHLGSLTGSSVWIGLAYGCLAHAETHVHTTSLYGGLAGVAATCVELGVLLDDKIQVQRGVEMIRRCVTNVEDGDLVSGTAGRLLALLGISQATGERSLIDDAICLADGWFRETRISAKALSLKSLNEASRERDGLSGLAHGLSGCAMALELLGRSTGEERWVDAADMARRYERGNEASGGERMSLQPGGPTWCWGAAGIGAERLAAARVGGNPQHITDANSKMRSLEAWLRAVYAGPDGQSWSHETNLSICHGLAGVADVLATAAMQLNESQYLEVAGGLTSLAGKYNSLGKVPSGLADGREAPGFMLGIAGLAYVLARLEAPEALPPATLPPLTSV